MHRVSVTKEGDRYRAHFVASCICGWHSQSFTFPRPARAKATRHLAESKEGRVDGDTSPPLGTSDSQGRRGKAAFNSSSSPSLEL